MTRVHHREGGYTTGQALAVLDIKAGHLRSLVEDGTLTETRTSGGQRRYDIEQVNALAAAWKAEQEAIAAGNAKQERLRMKRPARRNMFAEAEKHVCPACGALPGVPCESLAMGGPGAHRARLDLGSSEGRVVPVEANKNSLKPLASKGLLDRTFEKAAQLECPVCGAEPGKPCMEQGHELTSIHAGRYQAVFVMEASAEQREQETIEKVRQLYAEEDAAAMQRMEARTGGHVETPYEIAQKLIHDYFSLPKGMTLAEETPLSLTAHELRGLLIEAAVQNGWSQARKRSHNLDVDCLTCGAAVGQTCNPEMQPDQLYAGWHRSRIERTRERMYRGGDF